MRGRAGRQVGDARWREARALVGRRGESARARAGIRAGSWVSEGTLGVQEARASDARAGRKGNSDARASVRGWELQ